MPRPLTIGCVSFLNARPLIHGLPTSAHLRLLEAVPSALLPMLLSRSVDIALCPVIDYQLSPEPLLIVPVGGIGCAGPTLTVRLFSRVPIDHITQLQLDRDSHTSNILAQIILHHLTDRRAPESLHLIAPDAAAPSPQAMLLIGDKVINAAPNPADYPHQLDLGTAWRDMTGMPFLFAVWMCRAGQEVDVGPAAAVLEHQRLVNAGRIDPIVAACAPAVNWPLDLAHRYLSEFLRYEVGPAQLEAMQRFWSLAHVMGLTQRCRPLVLHGVGAEPVS
jgi:chorismate dehydratase